MNERATENRKEHKRLDVNLQVKVKYDDVDEFVEHFAKNISRGGIFIQSDEPQPKGTVILFEIQLKDGKTVIRGKGEVMWSRDRSHRDEKPRVPGMGVKFLALGKSSKEIVKRIIQSKEKRELLASRTKEDSEVSQKDDESNDALEIDIDIEEPSE